MVTLSPYFSVPYTGYFGSETFSRILHFFALSWKKFLQRCHNATSFYVSVWVIRENIFLWKEFWSTFTKIFHHQNKLVYGIQIFIFYHVGFEIIIYSLLTLYRSIERATEYEAQRTGQKENSRDKGYKLKGKVNVMKCSTSNQCYCDNWWSLSNRCSLRKTSTKLGQTEPTEVLLREKTYNQLLVWTIPTLAN